MTTPEIADIAKSFFGTLLKEREVYKEIRDNPNQTPVQKDFNKGYFDTLTAECLSMKGFMENGEIYKDYQEEFKWKRDFYHKQMNETKTTRQEPTNYYSGINHASKNLDDAYSIAVEKMAHVELVKLAKRNQRKNDNDDDRGGR